MIGQYRLPPLSSGPAPPLLPNLHLSNAYSSSLSFTSMLRLSSNSSPSPQVLSLASKSGPYMSPTGWPENSLYSSYIPHRTLIDCSSSPPFRCSRPLLPARRPSRVSPRSRSSASSAGQGLRRSIVFGIPEDSAFILRLRPFASTAFRNGASCGADRAQRRTRR